MRSKLIWVALALLLANLQCVASCSIQGCDGPQTEAAMPCHPHPDHSPAKASACPHHTVMAHAPSVTTVATPVATCETMPPLELRFAGLTPVSRTADASPPPLKFILRI